MQVLLVHGLGRTPLSLFGLAAALRRAGHRTRFFGYSCTLESVPRITRRLNATLCDLSSCDEPVGLVGHSLGGLLLRMTLPEVPELRVRHLVTLGTPQSLPRIATLAWRWFPPFRVFTRDCGRLLSSLDRYKQLPELAVPFTLIAGTAGPRGRWTLHGDEPNDGVVTVEETRHGDAEPVLVPGLHSFLMDSAAARERILAMMS